MATTVPAMRAQNGFAAFRPRLSSPVHHHAGDAWQPGHP